MTSHEDMLRRAIGIADLFELLSVAFAYPTEDFAQALADGSVADDWCACWEDAAGEPYDADAAGFTAEPLSAPATYEQLRREYSRLYLLPGKDVIIWPYEGAFKYRRDGREGAPGLFRTPTCLDVERQMKEAGVITNDARSIPADSINKELEFMAYLLGCHARSLSEADDELSAEEDEWAARAATFAQDHVLNWMGAFMEQTIELTRLDAYKDLARLAIGAIGLLSANCQPKL